MLSKMWPNATAVAQKAAKAADALDQG